MAGWVYQEGGRFLCTAFREALDKYAWPGGGLWRQTYRGPPMDRARPRFGGRGGPSMLSATSTPLNFSVIRVVRRLEEAVEDPV